MEATILRYELSGDGQGLKKWFRGKNGAENFYHVHSDEMTELERWIHSLLSSPDSSVYRLTAEEMKEAESVMEEMGNDPDAIACELVWRRHHMPNASST